MLKNSQNGLIVNEKHGIPVYSSNPSVPDSAEIKKSRRAQLGNEQRGLVVDNGTGEILGHGGAIVYEWEEVDKERFVKLYLAGLKQAAGMKKAGLAVFEEVYSQVRENPGKDEVRLSQNTTNLSPATFRRGIRELLERQFLFRSPYDGTFFVNIRFMFNGDRLAFVKGYKVKGADPRQTELPLEETPKIAAE